MKLTFQITDEQLAVLKESLRISIKHYPGTVGKDADGCLAEYVRRILDARHALELSNSMYECCFDAGPEPKLDIWDIVNCKLSHETKT